MNVLIKSAKIIAPAQKELHLKKRDILVTNGHIAKIAANITPPNKATKEIRFNDLHISLGWFDSGVSFGEPGHEDRETIANGLNTASISGFTDVVLNSNTYPVPDSGSDIVYVKNAGKRKGTSLHPLGCLTNLSEGEHLAELFDLHQNGAVGFYDFRKPTTNANLLKIALQYAQNFNGLVYSFPLDTSIAGKGVVNEGTVSTTLGLKGIPSLAETLQITRDLSILEYTGGRLHIPTITTAASVKLIAAAKKRGLDVSCSATVHHLWFNDTVLSDFDTDFKVMPPLRTTNDAKALIKGLKNGTIDYVTSDHTPLTIEEKRVEFDHAAYGTLGMESAFGILNQVFDLDTTITLLIKGRERYGIPVPSFKTDTPANFTLFEPNTVNEVGNKPLKSTSRNNAFKNQVLKGNVLGIINKEHVII